MDAQNAADNDQTRPSAASPHRRRASLVDQKTAASVNSSASPTKEDKSRPSSARADDADDDRDSDAETIVLPGKDGHSPSKARKVRQEDKGESDGGASKDKGKPNAPKSKNDDDKDADADGDDDVDGGTQLATTVRRKRLSNAGPKPSNKDAQSRDKDGASSGLSSAPNSPTQTKKRLQRRRSDAAPASPSDSEGSTTHKSSKSRDKHRSGDRLVSQKRKAPKVESDDEADGRKARRQRTTSAGVDAPRGTRDGRTSSRPQRDLRTQSTSPPPRQHRRSTSTQLQSSNGLQQKKKRLPPPLQPTDYQSDESSASGSPHPRSTKLRSLVTPSHSDAHVSPARIQPHKKHLDAHGQTLLARACARGEYDGVKQRLLERPEDVNVADYAGNTPLQIAAINGAEDIVKLLLDAGCNVDCVNYDKDTPLLDAVDNGHLEVVKLLLDAGVNPRKANVNGEEPIDRVTEDTDNAEEMRAALIAARKRIGGRRRTSEDRHSHNDPDGRDSNAPDSPRRSPAALPSSRRSGTVRSTKTRNDLLYMPLDDKTLRQAAGRGDEETVARVLQVKEGFDDPESMVAAARGGHDLVIQLLLGLGGANADPAPVSSLQAEFATPILAAIGQENIKVVELLLEQQGFDPTRRFKGETYYEIARRRQGTNWKEEEELLRSAYDEHKRSHKDGVSTKSPGRREREREEKRSRRDEARAEAKREKRTAASPTREERAKAKQSSPSTKRRSASFSNNGDGETQKRGPGRPRKASINASDREVSPNVSAKPPKTKRTESDAAASSDGDSKPRRKLISKGELRGERDKQKRPGSKDPSSPHASRTEDSEKQKVSEKYHDRAKALKRDETRESDASSKRHRASVTPERPNDADKDDTEAPVKRRRLDGDGQEKKSKRSSNDDKPSKASSKDSKGADDEYRNKSSTGHRASGKSDASDKQVHIKSEDVDMAMPDAPAKETDAVAEKMDDADAVKKKEEEEAAKEEEERKRLEEEKKKKQEEEAARKREEEERAKKAEEEERQRREAEEAARREEEEKKKREEAEKKRKEEEEKKKKEEEERKQREEEERQHREKLEREAAEEEKRQREEEERKERERRHREEMERKRAAREAEARRVREEQERAKLDKLPPLLRWLQMCSNPKSEAVAEKFRFMSGVRYDTIRPEATGTPEGREQWVLNTHVALLLGEKDLDLSRYTAWERAPVSRLAKVTLWRVEWDLYSLTSEKYWDLGRQLPGYYGDEGPDSMSFKTKQRLKQAAWERFLNTDMFFVKLSELLYTVSNTPHLRNVMLAVEYRELLENEAQAIGWQTPQKWKQDPNMDRYFGFAPRHKYYLNGAFVKEDLPSEHAVSKTPFPEMRLPRRGLVQVAPDDPDYERICIEQGLTHLVKKTESPSLPNGIHAPVTEQSVLVNGANGHGPNGMNGSSNH